MRAGWLSQPQSPPLTDTEKKKENYISVHRSNDVAHEHHSASQHLLKAPAAFRVSLQAGMTLEATSQHLLRMFTLSLTSCLPQPVPGTGTHLEPSP